MHAFLYAIVTSLHHIGAGTTALTSTLASTANRGPAPSDYTMTAIVITSCIVALGCCAWAMVERLRAVANRETARKALENAQCQIRFREAMISACPEAIAVLGDDMSAPLSYRGGSALLEACLHGPNAVPLAIKTTALIESGIAFALTVRTAGHPVITVRGLPIGSRAVVFFRIEEGMLNSDPNFRAALDAMPFAAWIRGRDLALQWANVAFLAATGTRSLDQALATDTALDRSELDLARSALEGNETFDARRYAVIGGKRRALELSVQRLAGSGVIGTAVDVTSAALAEAQLVLNADADAEMADHVLVAMALFGADERLVRCNRACRALWALPEEWLAANPTQGEIFDRLREMRRLPEQPDFSAWKHAYPELYEGGEHKIDEFCASAGRPKPARYGAAESARWRLSAIRRHQRKASFGDIAGDGRTGPAGDARYAGRRYRDIRVRWTFEAAQWRVRQVVALHENDLAGKPHLKTVARLAASRVGRDSLWDIVSASVNASEPERYGEWSRVERADGRIVSLSMARLPDGATMVSFKDFTDLERFQAGLSERTKFAD